MTDYEKINTQPLLLKTLKDIITSNIQVTPYIFNEKGSKLLNVQIQILNAWGGHLSSFEEEIDDEEKLFKQEIYFTLLNDIPFELRLTEEELENEEVVKEKILYKIQRILDNIFSSYFSLKKFLDRFDKNVLLCKKNRKDYK